jgi:hypothetical protein
LIVVFTLIVFSLQSTLEVARPLLWFTDNL